MKKSRFFTPDHIVTGAGIAADIDALDIGARTFVDGEDDRHGVLLEIAIAARAHDRERITATRRFDLHFLDRFFQRFGIVERAYGDARIAAHRVRIEGADRRLEIDGSDSILLTFLDLEGNEEALLLGIILGQRGHHLHIGETVLEIEAANQIAVGLDPIRIIDVAATEEAQQV